MRWLPPKHVAERLDCSKRQANRLMNNGTLPAVKVGSLIRVSEEALDRLMRKLERESAQALNEAGSENDRILTEHRRATPVTKDKLMRYSS